MTAQEILKKIIDEHGGYALFAEENKRRLSGMIGDYFYSDRKMSKMLRLAVNENIGCRLLKVKDSDSIAIEIKKLKYNFHEENGLEEKLAAQVVDCFAFALGLERLCTPYHPPEPEKVAEQSGTFIKSTPSEHSTFREQTVRHSAEPEMVFVQGGTFMMGATPEQGNDCYDNEKPAHRVTVSDFYIGKCTITQAQWKAVMGNNPSGFRGDDLPVEQVIWNDVQDFIRRLNSLTGKPYRLPTEAEWEFAARGGNSSRGYKYSGSNTLSDVAWHYENSGNKTHPVGTKAPNELGIYDMSGNVFEWCSDWDRKYSNTAQINPQGNLSGSHRVSRGGSWHNVAGNTRVSYRYCWNPDGGGNDLGFRLACS